MTNCIFVYSDQTKCIEVDTDKLLGIYITGLHVMILSYMHFVANALKVFLNELCHDGTVSGIGTCTHC